MNRSWSSKLKGRDAAYLLVGTGLGVAGYFAFRAMYFAGAPMPFAQEMVLVFLGAVATIYLTAALLNRQTELELRKEGRVIVLQQKNEIYMACIEKVAEIVEAERHDPELIDELRVLNHKLSVVGSSEVIGTFEAVLERLTAALRDGLLSGGDAQSVMTAVAEMTSAMRKDILQEVGAGEEKLTRAIILRNSGRMERLDEIETTARADAPNSKEDQADART